MSKLLVGSRKGLLVFNSEKDWSLEGVHFDGIPVPHATIDPRTGSIWAANDHGHWGQKLHRSDDNGKTWKEIVAPKFPANTYVKNPSGAEQGEKKEAAVSYIWFIQPGSPKNPNRIYLGTCPGGLFVSDDNGETFELCTSLWNHESRTEHWFGGGRNEPGICSIFLDPSNEQRISVAVSCGGVFVSEDAGKTWEGRNKGLVADFLPDKHAQYGHDPHYMTFCQSQPDMWWQQNHCGIFKSENAGKEWKKVSEENGPAHFGWAIVADESDKNTAYVIPALSDESRRAYDHRLMVCKTTDGGSSWKQITGGLPQENCFDIVYRHAFAKRADKLAFGTTTGNIFVSDNTGDNWKSLGNFWPMVYSVTFA